MAVARGDSGNIETMHDALDHNFAVAAVAFAAPPFFIVRRPSLPIGT